MRLIGGVVIGVALAVVGAGSALGAGLKDAAECESFWVSPAGNDAGPGTQRKPWKTVEHARDTLRFTKPACAPVVNLKAGTYQVDKTISFDDRDSGVTYRSVDGPGKAVFEAAREVTGWTPYQDGIFKAPVDIDQPFYSLYVDGERATTARYPNRQSDDKWAPYLRSILFDSTKEAVRDQLGFNADDIDPSWDLRLGTSWRRR